ncbi:MAG: hypothetical protein E5V40_01805 [Mesorhizobium sp.]|nr:MAG: hypothetical protein E5V40_01805 [Mesorhizobium sp.]
MSNNVEFGKEVAKAVEERILQSISERLEADLLKSIYGPLLTTNVVPQENVLNVTEMVREWEQMLRAFRRDQVTFRADAAHCGPMLKMETPNDGSVIELSFMQAQQIHDQWPLKLHKIVDAYTAEFVPATGFDRVVPMRLPKPPFQIEEKQEMFCEKCSGTGWFGHGMGGDTCDACHGKGHING